MSVTMNVTMNESKSEKRAFKEGEVAFNKNEMEGANPYQVNDREYGAWGDGWQCAQTKCLSALHESKIPNISSPPEQTLPTHQ